MIINKNLTLTEKLEEYFYDCDIIETKDSGGRKKYIVRPKSYAWTRLRRAYKPSDYFDYDQADDKYKWGDWQTNINTPEALISMDFLHYEEVLFCDSYFDNFLRLIGAFVVENFATKDGRILSTFYKNKAGHYVEDPDKILSKGLH